MRLILMGTPGFGLPTFEALGRDHDIVAVYSQPPRPAGRGMQLRKSPVQEWAEGHGLAVHTPPSLKNLEIQEQFRAHQADAAVVIAYGLLLPQPILDAPRLGCINLHGSLLPRWRGAAPIERAIEAGDETLGLCVMVMDAGLDTGPVLACRSWGATLMTRADQQRAYMAQAGAELLPATLVKFAQGRISPKPQPNEGATYAKKIEKSELRIDWSKPAAHVIRHIHAFNEWGAWTMMGEERLKILSAEMAADVHQQHKAAPGAILAADLTVACGQGALHIRALQRPGKKPLPIGIALTGWSIPIGTILE